MGNLAFFDVNTPVLQMLTLPTILMTLALPFRLYMVAISPILLGWGVIIYVTYQQIELPTQTANLIADEYGAEHLSSTRYIYISVYGFVVLSSCIGATLTNERLSRSLFMVRQALVTQRDALINDMDNKQ